MKFLENAPRFLFFTGKGGVGKTSVACAAALTLVSADQKVLLVSTDPASNVGQVFGVSINSIAAAHPHAPFLRTRAASEIEQIEQVHTLAGRFAIIPLLSEEPTGERKLAAMTASTFMPV